MDIEKPFQKLENTGYSLEDFIKKANQQAQVQDISLYREQVRTKLEGQFIQKPNTFLEDEQYQNAQEIFKFTFPKKIIQAMTNQINQKMRAAFSNQDEKQIKKKLFKLEQVYEYFGVKLIMGFIRMPDFEDYFDENAIFQTRISDMIKEGRFKCLEQWAIYTDKALLKSKFSTTDVCVRRICKKISKIQMKAATIGQELLLIKNTNIGLDYNCVMIMDVQSQVILSVDFQHISEQNYVLQLLVQFKGVYHRIYFEKDLLSFEEMVYLERELQIYSVGIVEKPFNITQLPMYHPQIALFSYENQILASTSFLPDIQERYNKLFNPISYFFRHKYRCDLSYNSINSALMSEIQEISVWNGFIFAQQVLEQQCMFEQFRMLLAKELLGNKIKIIESSFVVLPITKPKCCSVQINTEISGQFGNNQSGQLNQSAFHIPNLPNIPKSYNGSMNCIVCKQPSPTITQCRPCSDLSAKVVILCACECFFRFHQSPHDYIVNAEDINFVIPRQDIDKRTIID